MTLALLRRALPGVALLLAAFAPTPALAHARLTRTEPAAKARLDAPPREIVLWFSLAPEPTFTRVTLLRDGDTISVGAAARVQGSPLAVRVPVLGALAPGRYTVRWQSAVSDGHPLRGSFTFVVAGPAADTTLATAAAPADTARPDAVRADSMAHMAHMAHELPAAAGDSEAADSADHAHAGAESVTPGAVLLRTLEFGALLAIVGAVVFQRLVLRPASAALGGDGGAATGAARRAAGIGVGAALLLAAANVGRLLQESRSLLGPEGAAGVGDVLTQTRWGLGWLLQAAATVVAALAFVRARGAREGSRAWGLAAVAAAALAFSPALTGHAAAMGRLAPVAIAADGFHVLGAGGWMGTLLLLALAGLPAARLAGERRGHFVAVMVGAFSPLALVFASVIALSGVASGAIHMGSLSNLWTTRYGRTLLLKVAAVGLVAAVGAYNWRRVLPDLPESAAADRLRRTSALELAASALVVLLTALLTGLEPGE